MSVRGLAPRLLERGPDRWRLPDLPSGLPTAAALVAIVAVGAGVRLYGLDRLSLWLDEAYSVAFARLPLADLWGPLAVEETNPPLYYSLLHVWMRLFGESEAAVRGLSVLFGTAAIPLMYLLGREAGGRAAGLAGAALLALSGIHVQYSQEARAYAMAVTAVLATLVGLAQILHRVAAAGAAVPLGGAGPWALYSGGLAVALYSHNTLALLPVVLNPPVLWSWLRHGPRRSDVAMRWVAANAAALAAWAWWLQALTRQAEAGGVPWIRTPDLVTALATVRSVYGHKFLYRLAPAGELLFLLLALLGTARARRRGGIALLMLPIVVGLPALTFAISLAVPIFLERTLLWPVVGALTLIAAGATALRPRALAAAALALALLLQARGAANYHADHVKEPWREIAARVLAEAGPRDALLFVPWFASLPFHYYARDRSPASFATRGAGFEYPGPGYRRLSSLTETPLAQLRERLARYDRIWVVTRNRALFDPDDAVARELGRFARPGADLLGGGLLIRVVPWTVTRPAAR